MYIVQIASECAPVAKVGGLGDVVFGLSREMEIRGNAVEVILPKYDCMRYDRIWGLQVSYSDLAVPWYGGSIPCTVWFGFVHGRKCFFIEPHSGDGFFQRGTYYGEWDDPMRFVFFSKAALEFLLRSNKRPDVIHCHDWQTGLAAVLLYELYGPAGMENVRACYTVHNFRHQGATNGEILSATGLGRPERFFVPERMQDPFDTAKLNLMKAGIVYSNFVTTVSPHHAWEAMHTDQGRGLQQTLEVHRSKFGGILNGIDYEVWNPAGDPEIACTYDAGTLERKYVNKEALRERFWLRQEYKPLIAYVGRLDDQKGVHLVRHGISYALAHGAQFVLLGTAPDPAIRDQYRELKGRLNDHPDCHLELSYNEELAHLIYAGADLLLVPSNYEPCGLSQIIALRYGTVPIVRGIGGLVNTVFDVDHFHAKPVHERNGFVFMEPSYEALEGTLYRAIRLWVEAPDRFRDLMLSGMGYDFSWNHPGQDYLAVYDYIRHK
jgi:starch synthase